MICSIELNRVMIDVLNYMRVITTRKLINSDKIILLQKV